MKLAKEKSMIGMRLALVAGLPASLFALCLVGLFPVSTGASLAAQENSQKASSNICMTKKLGAGNRFAVILPEQFAATLEMQDFKRAKCGEVMYRSRDRIKYRNDMCQMATKRSKSLQDAYANDLGVRPATLCGLAEMAVGPWKRGDDQ